MQKEDKAATYIANANGLADLEGRSTPCQEHNTLASLTILRRDASCCDSLQNGGRKHLPALFRVGVRLVCSNSQAGIQPQYTLFCNFGEIAEEWSIRRPRKPKKTI